ncbi:MAG: glycosyltransferase N-terminal domain-containing protein [Bacteroidia bacterium]
MNFLYTLSIHLLTFGIKAASLFNSKAKDAITGRRGWRSKLQDKLKNNKQDIIWIHVSSLGEFEQARPLIVRIKQEYPQYKILLTFFSPSGYNARKDFEYADYVFYLPYDTPRNVTDFMDIVKPKFILFVKYEFWLNYLNEIIKRKKQYDLKCFLISSIFRKHQPFFKWYGGIFRRALAAFDIIFVQDKLSVKLLKKINIADHVYLSGDTRVDRVVEIARQPYKSEVVEKFCGNEKVIICGSTWWQDEKIIIPTLVHLQSQFKFKVIIAPHHPDDKNIRQLTELLKRQNLSYCRYTQIANDKKVEKSDVMIIDTIGVLNKIYRYGYLAYIGGGFSDGIHNILEPAAYGLPVIFGKKYQKFYEAVELIKMKGAYSVSNEKELYFIFQMLFAEDKVYTTSKNAVSQFITEQKGGVERTMNVLYEYLRR